jgi:hypothetical protein
MVATVIVLLAAAAAAGGFWFRTRRNRRPAARVPPPSAKAGGRFGGVEIRTRSGACRAAQTLHGKRFLAKNAPTLPLPECTATQCACTFSKLADRRTEGRRLEHGGLSASLFLAANRRSRHDRRRATQAPPQR